MAVYCDGTVTVTAPPFIPKILINHFVSKHTEWIAKKVQQVQTRPRLYTTRGNRKEFIAHREHALVLAQERLQHFNASYNFGADAMSWALAWYSITPSLAGEGQIAIVPLPNTIILLPFNSHFPCV